MKLTLSIEQADLEFLCSQALRGQMEFNTAIRLNGICAEITQQGQGQLQQAARPTLVRPQQQVQASGLAETIAAVAPAILGAMAAQSAQATSAQPSAA